VHSVGPSRWYCLKFNSTGEAVYWNRNSSQFSFLCLHRKVQEEYINSFLLATVLQLDGDAVEVSVISGSWLAYFMIGCSIYSQFIIGCCVFVTLGNKKE
jgi:hypothetical protein